MSFLCINSVVPVSADRMPFWWKTLESISASKWKGNTLLECRLYLKFPTGTCKDYFMKRWKYAYKKLFYILTSQLFNYGSTCALWTCMLSGGCLKPSTYKVFCNIFCSSSVCSAQYFNVFSVSKRKDTRITLILHM